MKRRTLISLVSLSLVALPAVAAEAPVKILATIAVQGALTELEPGLTGRAGVPVEMEFATTNRIVERLTRGESADLVVLTQAAVQQLAVKGEVKSSSNLVRSEVGIAVADTAPTPVMETTQDFIAFIKATPSIAYTAGGASGQHMAEVIARLGLSDVAQPKTTLVTQGFSATLLREGKVAAAAQQISELKFAGARNIVPLPDSIQSRLIFTAAALNGSTRADATARVLELLTAEQAAAAYQRAGLAPVFK